MVSVLTKLPSSTLFTSSPSLLSIGFALTAAVAGLLRIFLRRPKKADLPVYKVQDDVVRALEEAHEACPDTPFIFSMAGQEVVVLPVSDIETIKSLPESDVSIKRHHYNVFLGEYTYMGTKADEFDEAMRNVLTRNTPTVLASFTAEVDYAIQQTIGRCEGDWTPVSVRATMSRVASIMSGRAFVGLPLSRDPQWIEATVNYTQDVSRAWMVLKMIPWPLRTVVAPFLKEVKNLKSQRRINEEKLAPLIAEKTQGPAEEKGARVAVPGGDMIDWFIGRYRKTPTVQQIGRDQLLATFASIYNLSNALAYIIFDMAGYPEHIEELRQELKHVVGEGGIIDKSNLPKLRKLDSFARESQRLNPPSLVTIPRVVTNPNGLRTSTGHVIPQGYTTTIRAHSINLNPGLWEDPTRFDGFRFSRLRAKPGNEQKYQHSSTGVDNINFGHGIWACPGRFFAAAEIKVVMAYLLVNYDLKLVPGTKKPGQIHYGLATLPDPQAQILFRAREEPVLKMRWE